MLVEYGYGSQERYDGVSEIQCMDDRCKGRTGRWTKEVIPDGFVESRFGERGHVKIQDENTT